MLLRTSVARGLIVVTTAMKREKSLCDLSDSAQRELLRHEKG